MTQDLPKPDISRFSSLSAEVVTIAYLSRAKGAVTAGALKARLSAFVGPQSVDAAVSTFLAEGRATDPKSIILTEKGKEAAKKALGADASEDWEKIWKRRLPLIVLGLDPDNSDSRKKFAKSDALTAASIAVSFGLQNGNIASRSAICTELVWRILRAALPEVIGKGPFPAIAKPATVERVLLAGLANVRARNMAGVLSGLAAAAVGLKECDADTLRKQLIRIGLSRAASGGDLTTAVSETDFAARVKEVAGSLSTPPFLGRVAIAQVYDAYGKIHADAGTLDSFKTRLVTAAKERKLDLSRNDMPERMDKELRRRSEAVWGTDEVHFVVAKWT
jgi:hypothetical protein